MTSRREFIHTLGTAVALTTARSRAQTMPEVDFIVIGAGSAGCVLANRLSANPGTRVMLLEAGGPWTNDPALVTPGRWVSLLGTAVDWGYATEAEPGLGGRAIAWPRGKILGGSSAINAMAYVRGHRLDFDGWQRQGLDGWGYDQVLPAFKASEDNSRGASAHRGAGGPLRVSDCTDPHAGHAAFLDAARTNGYRTDPSWDFFQPEPENGAGYYQKNIKDGQRHSSAQAFLLPVMSRTNLRVLTGAQATRLLIEQSRVTGVEFTREGRVERVRAREVILSGGVIDSPRLLMLSGLGPADHLRSLGVPVIADLPGVGGNLQDHLKLSIRWQGRTTLPPSTVTAGLFVRSHSGTDAAALPPDLQFYIGRGLDQPDRFVTITVSLVRPASRGSVRLRSANPSDKPVIRANYLTDPRDVATLLQGLTLARTLGRSTAYEALRAEEIEPGASAVSEADLTAFMRRAVDTIYHPAGTCRMGTDDSAVVDARLRVRGVAGLRIADASVMPTVVSATTHAACVMIGAKAAELVRQS